MHDFLILLVVVFFIITTVLLVVLLLKISNSSNSDSTKMLKDDFVELSRSVNNLQSSVRDKIDKNNFEMQASMRRQLHESSLLVKNVTEKLTKLDETNSRVIDVATDLKTLQNVLQNPKQRGVFGEFYLKNLLDNILAPGQYQLQYKFKDGSLVDAVVFLDKKKILPIDSKFSLENYNRMVSTDDKMQKKALLNLIKKDLKMRIDETSKYIKPDENTMDFAFMFIPSESLYYDLLINSVGVGVSARDLIDYAFTEKRVIIVSPTSFSAYLQTVLQGLRSLEIEDKAKEIKVQVGKLARHISVYEQLMHKLGGSLNTTVNHYNNAHKELKKIDKDVVKIAETKEQVEANEVEKPIND